MRLGFLDDPEDAERIHQIAVMQMKIGIAAQMVYIRLCFHGGTSYDAVHLVALFKQKLGQIAAVLTGYAGDQRSFFHSHFLQ